MTDDIEKLIKKFEDIDAGTYEPESTPSRNPEHAPLYGGISGLPVSVPEFVLCDGLVVRETYAHVMAPYLMAFAPPASQGAPHPPPWKPARGGLGFDVTMEVALAQDARPTNIDRLNTLWWVLALLRLITGAPLRMPVISDIAFAKVPQSSVEPNLWTIEMPPVQLRTSRNQPTEVRLEHLEWVRDILVSGELLMRDPAFNRAFQTFDSAIWAHSLGSAVIMAWACLETLFRPGRRHITKTLSTCIATFLHPPGPDRDRAFQRIELLYEARGSATHDAQAPEVEQLLDSFGLARRALARCFELHALPDADELLQRWKDRR